MIGVGNRLCAASLYTFRVRLLLAVYANSSSPSFLDTIESRQMTGTDHGITCYAVHTLNRCSQCSHVLIVEQGLKSASSQ
jgi:hypothetical protein